MGSKVTGNNILYILVDQQRIDMLGAYGHPMVKTPNIDLLAAEGIRFTQAYTPTAICGPARTSLFTGHLPHVHGVEQNAATGRNRFTRADPVSSISTLGDHLKDYDKIYLGKWHIAESRLPKDYGFRGHNFPGYGYPASGVYGNLVFDEGPGKNNRYRYWLDERGRPYPDVTEAFFGNNPNLRSQEIMGRLSGSPEDSIPAFLASEAIDALEARKQEERPFFLWMNFWGPHTPCILPEPYYSMYDPGDIPEDASFRETFHNKPTHQKHISHMWGVHDLDWPGWAEILARYYGYITLIDHQIGRILDYLNTTGQTESTTVVYTADHGDAMGAHRLIEKGEFMYDETYHIPLIIRSPENPRRGRICDAFTYLHDLFPTAMDLAGEDIPHRPEARTLGPIIRDRETDTFRDAVFGRFTGHFTDMNQRMIRTRKHKLIFNGPTFGELYDLEKDPGEMENLITQPDYLSVKRQLITQLIAECRKQGDPAVEWINRIKDIY